MPYGNLPSYSISIVDPAKKYYLSLQEGLATVAPPKQPVKCFDHVYEYSQLPVMDSNENLDHKKEEYLDTKHTGVDEKDAIPVELDGQQKAAIKKAIDNEDITLLRKTLGLESLQAQNISRPSKSNAWKWLTQACEWAVACRTAEIIFDFARKEHFPKELNIKKFDTFKKELAKLEVTDLLEKLSDSLSNLATHYIKTSKTRIIQSLNSQLEELSTLNKPYRFDHALYNLKQQREKFELWLTLYEKAQKHLNKQYASLKQQAAEIWNTFSVDNKLSEPEQVKLKKLSAQPLAETILLQTQNQSLTILDYALQCCLKKPEEQRGELREIVKYLLLRGAKLTAKALDPQTVDLDLSTLLLQYSESQTQETQLVQRQLLHFSNDAKQIKNSFWMSPWIPRIIFSINDFNKDCHIAASLALLCCDSSDQAKAKLFKLIENKQNFGTAAFFKGLATICHQKDSGELLARPKKPQENEMETFQHQY